MSENNRNEEYIEGDVKIKTPFSEWLDNFFYHYKWHVIAAAFIIAVVLICTLQMCSKTSYDIHVMYAGDCDIKMRAEGSELSEYEELLGAVRKYVSDRDGDGERNTELLNLYLPGAEELARLEALRLELLEQKKESFEISYSLINSNRKTFSDNLMFGDYYVVIISDHLLYENVKNTVSPFVSVEAYLPEGAIDSGYRLAADCGVYVSSTPLADDAGFSSLPENTVIALRKIPANTANKSSSAEYYAFCEEVFRNMLSGEAYQ